MPCSISSAVYGVNPNEKKIPKAKPMCILAITEFQANNNLKKKNLQRKNKPWHWISSRIGYFKIRRQLK